MSANVWYEEVERGLKEEILNSVLFLDSKGNRVKLPEDSVFVRDPEEDLREEQFPCITITPLFNRFDSKRYNPNPVIMQVDSSNATVTLQDSAVSFNLFYQIDFWSRYKEDINLMTSTWLQNHFRQFNLSVIDDGGNKRSCNVLIQEGMRESNLLRNGKRLFHCMISYVIWVELDNEMNYNKPMVINREVKVEREE